MITTKCVMCYFPFLFLFHFSFNLVFYQPSGNTTNGIQKKNKIGGSKT